jgi:hypothetical protein
MAREIPEVVRAAAGLAATVLDEARKLPETLPGLPVRVIGFAMQKAMWAQQQYAGLVARGDELFTGLRGEDEPGLATFDDDLPDDVAPAAATGYRESAFDRAELPADEDLLSGLPEDDVALPDVEAAAGADAEIRAEFADNRAEEALDDIALDALVDDETAGLPPSPSPAEVVEAVEQLTAQVEAADVLTADGEVETVEATVPDEGDATAPAEAVDEGGTPVAAASGTSAPATAPVEGYDAWSIAQLRGRLRGYQTKTVTDLVAYEEATRSREPYLRMLRNRLEKLDEQAVEASPLAPRGS